MGDFSLTPLIPLAPTPVRSSTRSTTVGVPPPHPSEQAVKDLITITGGSGQALTLNFSQNSNMNKNVQKETSRVYDRVRIKHKDPETGKVDEDQFVDVDRPKKIISSGPGASPGPKTITVYSTPPASPTEEILERDLKSDTFSEGGSGAP